MAASLAFRADTEKYRPPIIRDPEDKRQMNGPFRVGCARRC